MMSNHKLFAEAIEHDNQRYAWHTFWFGVMLGLIAGLILGANIAKADWSQGSNVYQTVDWPNAPVTIPPPVVIPTQQVPFPQPQMTAVSAPTPFNPSPAYVPQCHTVFYTLPNGQMGSMMVCD